jgi:hypothetical protein
MEKFHISIASLPNRENLVAEIFYEGVQWVEISQETNETIIQFYAHPRQDHWEFILDDALEALTQAKKRLLDLEKRRT